MHKWGINNDAIQATWEYLYKVVVCSVIKSLEQIRQAMQLTHADAERFQTGIVPKVRALRAMYYYYLDGPVRQYSSLVLSSKVAGRKIL